MILARLFPKLNRMMLNTDMAKRKTKFIQMTLRRRAVAPPERRRKDMARQVKGKHVFGWAALRKAVGISGGEEVEEGGSGSRGLMVDMILRRVDGGGGALPWEVRGGGMCCRTRVLFGGWFGCWCGTGSG